LDGRTYNAVVAGHVTRMGNCNKILARKVAGTPRRWDDNISGRLDVRTAVGWTSLRIVAEFGVGVLNWQWPLSDTSAATGGRSACAGKSPFFSNPPVTPAPERNILSEARAPTSSNYTAAARAKGSRSFGLKLGLIP
jgi:hypothetical protein